MPLLPQGLFPPWFEPAPSQLFLELLSTGLTILTVRVLGHSFLLKAILWAGQRVVKYPFPGSFHCGYEWRELGMLGTGSTLIFPYPARLPRAGALVSQFGAGLLWGVNPGWGQDSIPPCVCVCTGERVPRGLHSTLKLFPYLIVAQVSAIRVTH